MYASRGTYRSDCSTGVFRSWLTSQQIEEPVESPERSAAAGSVKEQCQLDVAQRYQRKDRGVAAIVPAMPDERHALYAANRKLSRREWLPSQIKLRSEPCCIGHGCLYRSFRTP